MDSLIAAAARALAAGDALEALKRIALRDDPPVLALRGITMAQLGEYPRARELVRRAARGFGVHEELARALHRRRSGGGAGDARSRFLAACAGGEQALRLDEVAATGARSPWPARGCCGPSRGFAPVARGGACVSRVIDTCQRKLTLRVHRLSVGVSLRSE
ncbi:MAG: hypothetical protein AMXMBFR72_29530 [Betaproteobacteria bacterium]